MQNRFVVAAIACGALAAAGAAHADPVSAFGFSSATFATYDSLTAEAGYDFTTGNQPLAVTALGYINDGFDGTHTVSIFNVATQTLVSGATATVTTVGGGPASNTFTYATLADPALLAANTEYQIVSQFFPNEHYFIHALDLTSAYGITFNIAAYDDYNSVPATPTFAHGTAAGNGAGDFGPNFLVTGIPEPFTLSLFGAGLAGAAAARRRKKA